MDQVRIGLIGCGNMGSHHARYLPEISGAKFAAVCDRKQSVMDRIVAEHEGVKAFASAEELIDSGEVDAILIATPHYDHPPYAQRALKQGIHVLTEKPVGVTAKAAQQTNAVYEQAKQRHPGLLYAGMFQQRVNPNWRYVKHLCDSGALGPIRRASWTITSWFRSQAYYNSGGWRATWAGEGGGVLINQCPHNLDLFTWFVGTPSKVTASVGLGKYHDIEVEDEVNAILEFPNGATGSFITTTAEAPGVNRLEIVGDKGTVITGRGGEIEFFELGTPTQEFLETTEAGFATPETHTHMVKPGGKGGGHKEVTVNFVNVILGKEDTLIAPAVEGIRGLELGNAMLMSGLTGKPVNVPTDRDAFEALIQDLAAKSTYKKEEPEDAAAPAAMGGTF